MRVYNICDTSSKLKYTYNDTQIYVSPGPSLTKEGYVNATAKNKADLPHVGLGRVKPRESGRVRVRPDLTQPGLTRPDPTHKGLKIS